MAGSRSIVCGEFSGFCSLPPHPLLSTVYQCDGCLFFSGAWGSWLGCQVLPAIGAVSILELAANSGSSRMSWAPNLQRATNGGRFEVEWVKMFQIQQDYQISLILEVTCFLSFLSPHYKLRVEHFILKHKDGL